MGVLAERRPRLGVVRADLGLRPSATVAGSDEEWTCAGIRSRTRELFLARVVRARVVVHALAVAVVVLNERRVRRRCDARTMHAGQRQERGQGRSKRKLSRSNRRHRLLSPAPTSQAQLIIHGTHAPTRPAQTSQLHAHPRLSLPSNSAAGQAARAHDAPACNPARTPSTTRKTRARRSQPPSQPSPSIALCPRFWPMRFARPNHLSVRLSAKR